MIFCNVSRSLYKETFIGRLLISRMDHCFESKSTNIEQLGMILQYVFEGEQRERLFE